MKGQVACRLRPIILLLGGSTLLATGDCLPRHFWVDLAGSSIETATGEIITGLIGLFFP